MIPASADVHLHKTRMAYMWTRILSTPFWALYSLLPFIIYKDLHATAWQVACIISLKPIVSVFSLYWSALIKKRSDRLISNIVWASIFSHLPFLFAPFIDNPWYFVLASAVYMLFHRGVNPAWMEVLKINVPEESRKRVFAYGSAIYHVGGGLLSIIIGWLLSDYFQAWRWLFPLTAVISFGSVFLQGIIPLKYHLRKETENCSESFSLIQQFKQPWKESWELLKKRPDFLRFQIGFMLGGGGLMLWQPALPIFFFDTLNLSYKELTVAMTLCKGIGYALALPLWTNKMNQSDIFLFSGAVTLIAALFPVCLMFAQWHLIFLFIAYLIYGMMQTGSELSWNLSGPIFAKNEDSSLYSSINVVSVGLRGFIAPPLGSFLCTTLGANLVLVLGAMLCLSATYQMYVSQKKEEQPYPLLR